LSSSANQTPLALLSTELLLGMRKLQLYQHQVSEQDRLALSSGGEYVSEATTY